MTRGVGVVKGEEGGRGMQYVPLYDDDDRPACVAGASASGSEAGHGCEGRSSLGCHESITFWTRRQSCCGLLACLMAGWLA